MWAVSPVDRATRAQHRLDAPPVLDGMMASGKSIYIAGMDGKIACWHRN